MVLVAVSWPKLELSFAACLQHPCTVKPARQGPRHLPVGLLNFGALSTCSHVCDWSESSLMK